MNGASNNLRLRPLRYGLAWLGRCLGPTRGGQGTGEDDRKSPPECAMQSRQKHSILSLHKLVVKSRKGFRKSSGGTQNVNARFHSCAHWRNSCFSSQSRNECNSIADTQARICGRAAASGKTL